MERWNALDFIYKGGSRDVHRHRVLHVELNGNRAGFGVAQGFGGGGDTSRVKALARHRKLREEKIRGGLTR